MKCPKFKLPGFMCRKWFYFLTVLILIMGGFLFWQQRQKAQNGLETYTVTPKDLKKYVTASGEITAENQVTLRFQTTGQLSWVGVKKGDHVNKWQAIASINQKELEKKLKKELEDYMTARWDFETTQRDTYKDQVLTDVIQRTKDKSQFELNRSVLDVEIADIAKKYATLVTPIAGIVTEATDEQPGINVSLSNTQYVITDPDSLRFTAEVEEMDIGRVVPGLSATLILDAFPEETLSTQVGSISFTATETISGTTAYEVELDVPKQTKYRLGMNGDVEILVEEKPQVLAVPIEAVKSTAEQDLVTLLQDDQEVEVPVTLGLETENYYEVVSGLKAGDLVVLPQD